MEKNKETNNNKKKQDWLSLAGSLQEQYVSSLYQ